MTRLVAIAISLLGSAGCRLAHPPMDPYHPRWRIDAPQPEVLTSCPPPPACAHEMLRAEVVCDSCGQPMRIELRMNRGRK